MFATNHEDRNECLDGEKFGWSEEAEDYVMNMISARGYSVIHDWGNCYNAESGHWDTRASRHDTHYYSNNGYCSKVNVP